MSVDRKNIGIIFTGGTISMEHLPDRGGVVPALSPEQILARAPQLHTIANITPFLFGNYPGPHMTPERMFALTQLAQQILDRPDIDGVVITHGTDTLEETAFFLDLTLHTAKPVVFVGSIRNASEPDWDGPRNLRDGILIASHPDARNLGVLVCLAEEIHAASEVSKLDTSHLHTFASPNFGPIGRIVHDQVFIYRQPVHRDTFHLQHLPRLVPLLKCYAGAEPDLYDCLLHRKPQGLVVEALGVGNVPPSIYPKILDFLRANIPVVLTSRCPIGRVEHIYAYEGAGRQLHHAGVIFADYLNGQKARIKLIVALGANCDRQCLREIFEWA